MPSTTDLMNAISNGDLNSVQYILNDRDHQGIPRVDINRGFGNAETALLWALWCKPVNELIVQTLLDVRDNANNPVSDINYIGPHGQTVLSLVLSRNIEPDLRRRLLQRILDVRGANGELVTDVTADDCNIPLLKQAQELNDIHCFRILHDVRTAAGAFALDINEIRHKTTVLDSAMRGGIYYRRDQTMIETIQQLGGLRAREIPPLVRREQEERQQQQRLQQQRLQLQVRARQERRVHEHPAAIIDPEVQQFIDNIQNTHLSEVTISVAASIKKLKTRYPHIHTTETLQVVRNFLTQLPDSNLKKAYAINCLDRIERDPTEHALSNGTKLPQALALIWTGIQDKSALVEGLEELTEQDVAHRKTTLVEHLFQAQTEYGNGGGGISACFVGTLNKIVETLDRAHPDVTIITGSAHIMTVALERAPIIVRDELRKKSVSEQRSILKSWDDVDKDNEKTIATKFRQNMVAIANVILEEEFQQLLTEKKRKEITGAFDDLPRPTLHKELDKLINTINQLDDNDNDNQSRRVAILRIREQANQAYDERDRTLQEEYELLLNTYNRFIFMELGKLIKTINQLHDNDNLSRQAAILRIQEQANQTYDERDPALQEKYELLLNTYNSFMELDKLITTINQLHDNDNQSRQVAILRIKEQANQTYDEGDRTFQEKYELLLNTYNSFMELDKLITTINQLHDNDNHSRQVAILRIKEQANQAYNERDRALQEEKYELLLNTYNSFMDLDKLIKTINQSHDNQLRQAAIVCLKEQAYNAYEKNTKTFSEVKISLINSILDEILDEFKNKIDAVGTHNINAKLKAAELLKDLNEYKNEAFKVPSTDSLSLFAKQSKEAIKKAIPILQRDLGWGDYLLNLAKQLINTVTTTIAVIATSGSSNHHGFFALKPSDAVNKYQELTQAISSFSRGCQT